MNNPLIPAEQATCNCGNANCTGTTCTCGTACPGKGCTCGCACCR